MATNYSTLLGLALPTQGELSGTWGDVVNNYITNYLDAAVAGTQTLATDADVTLTKTTGSALSSTSSQYAIINCTGARTALRTITAPAASKIYTIINATTGGFGVKIVGVGPTTGVTIASGTRAVVAWNGSDFNVLTVADASGVAPVVNGGTGVATLTGLAYGNGTSAFTAASAAQVVAVIGSTAVTNANNLIGSGTISSTATGTTKAYGTADTTMATTAFADGMRDVPSNPQTTSYTLALADRGKSIDFTGAVGQTITIPANASVAFPTGTVISITNYSGNVLTVGITSDTLRMAGTTNTGSRTLAAYAVATVRKVDSTTWFIAGTGVS